MRAGWSTFPLPGTVRTASAHMWVRLCHHHGNYTEKGCSWTRRVQTRLSRRSQMEDFRPSKLSLTSGDDADGCLSPALFAWVVIHVHACVGSACWFMLNLWVLLIWRCTCVSAHTLTDFSMAAIKPRVDSWLPGRVPVCASPLLAVRKDIKSEGR